MLGGLQTLSVLDFAFLQNTQPASFSSDFWGNLRIIKNSVEDQRVWADERKWEQYQTHQLLQHTHICVVSFCCGDVLYQRWFYRKCRAIFCMWHKISCCTLCGVQWLCICHFCWIVFTFAICLCFFYRVRLRLRKRGFIHFFWSFVCDHLMSISRIYILL